MSLFVISLDFHAANMDLRGRAVPQDPRVLNEILNPLSEKVWLSTCNRVEIYGVENQNVESSPYQRVETWIKLCRLDPEAAKAFQIHKGQDAYEHLFRVTASLESMVVGETQIQGQVKRAYDDAIAQKNVGVILHRAFQRAFKVSKKIRSQTEVGRLAVSIPSIGVKLAEKIVGNLDQQSVGILGLGEIGRTAAEHFASVQPKEIYLYNRTGSVAEDLAQRLKDQKVSASCLKSPQDLPTSVNILVSAADAPLISKDDLLKRDATGDSFFVLDLAVPSQIPSISLNHGYIFRIDDLQKIAEENSSLRRQELVRAEKMIEQEITQLMESENLKSLDETLRDVSQKTTLMTESELQALRLKLPHLSEADWKEIEKMARRLSSKVLQDPMVELKSLSKQGEESETLVQFFRSLFRI